MSYKATTNGEYAQISIPALIKADADITQLITVTSAGTPVQGPNKTNPGGWIIKAAPANTGVVYFMFHGQTAAAKGFPLSAGEAMVLSVENLNELDFDAAANGLKVHATKI